MAAQLRAQAPGDELGVSEDLDSLVGVNGQGLDCLRVTISGNGWRRRNAFGNAVVNGGQCRGHEQIGVGVGTGHPMFDSPRFGGAGRHSNCDGAILLAPSGVGGRVYPGFKSAI